MKKSLIVNITWHFLSTYRLLSAKRWVFKHFNLSLTACPTFSKDHIKHRARKALDLKMVVNTSFTLIFDPQTKNVPVCPRVQKTSRNKPIKMRYVSRGSIRCSRTTSTSPRYNYEYPVTETRVLISRGVDIKSCTRPATGLEIKPLVNSSLKLGVS